jgi:hypothetical protein
LVSPRVGFLTHRRCSSRERGLNGPKYERCVFCYIGPVRDLVLRDGVVLYLAGKQRRQDARYLADEHGNIGYGLVAAVDGHGSYVENISWAWISDGDEWEEFGNVGGVHWGLGTPPVMRVRAGVPQAVTYDG